MNKYYESPTITIPFDIYKKSTTLENLVIPSIHFDHIKQVINILFKVGEGVDVSKYYEPTTKTISQEMDHVGIDPGVPETGKSTRDKLKDHPDW